jgi:hypothetical protein
VYSFQHQFNKGIALKKKKKPGGSMQPAQGYSIHCDVSTSSIEQLLLTIGKGLN